MIYLVPSPLEDKVIDDLYELVDGRPTVWAATEVFIESSRMTHLAPFLKLPTWRRHALGKACLSSTRPSYVRLHREVSDPVRVRRDANHVAAVRFARTCGTWRCVIAR